MQNTEGLKHIRVAYISTCAGHGSGAEISLAETLRYLDREKTDPFLICPAGAFLEFVAHDLNIPVEKITFHKLPTPRLFRRFAFLWSMPWWILKLRQIRPHIIHCNSLSDGEYGAIISLLFGIPCVVHVRDPSLGRITRTLFRLVGTRRLVFVYVSRYAVSRVANLVGDNDGTGERVIYDFRLPYLKDKGKRTELRATLGIHDNELMICTAGRIYPDKGQMEFVEAGLRYNASPPAHWLIIGDASYVSDQSYYQQVSHRVKNAGNPYVRLLGYRADARDIIECADIVIVASQYDSFPGVVLEAMASGKPVIAMRYETGAAEMIVHGETGFLLDSRTPDIIANYAQQLAGNTDLREKMGQAGRARLLKMFNPQKHIAALIKVYENSIATYKNN